MTTPAVRILLLVFIGKDGGVSTTMQVECHHVGGGERLLREIGQEQFVDNSGAFDAHPALRFPGWMGCHDDITPLSLWSYSYVRTIVERAHQGTFRAAKLLIGGKMQTHMDMRGRKLDVPFAPRNARETSHRQQERPRCHIAHLTAARHGSVGTGRQRGSFR